MFTPDPGRPCLMSVTFLEPLTPTDFINVETDSTHAEERQPTTCKQILAHLHTEMTEALRKSSAGLVKL